MQVIGVNMALEAMMLSDGSAIMITNWLDEDGDDCDKDTASYCVAGPCESGLWYNADLSEFSENVLN